MLPLKTGLGTVAALAALAAVGRLLFLWWPNVALTYVVVFAAGAAFGWRVGAATGFLSIAATDLLLSGLHPVLFVNAPAMALLGVAGGALARLVDLAAPGPFAAGAAALVGVLATVVFSVVADALSWALFFRPAGGDASVLRALVLAGLAFNAVPAAVNALVFGAGLPPTLRAARAAGLLPARPGPAETAP